MFLAARRFANHTLVNLYPRQVYLLDGLYSVEGPFQVHKCSHDEVLDYQEEG